jgi:hypothetical protein
MIYGASSNLQYNSGGSYGRGFEWYNNGVGTIGTTPGYPNNVSVNNNTTLDYVNTGTPGVVLNKATANHLTISAGSTLNMNTGGVSTGGDLYVGGNLTVAGTLNLGAAVGDDIRVAGNVSVTGTFNGNNRAIWFNKSSGTQTITAAAGITIPYIVFDSTGNRTVSQAAGTSVSVSAPLTGNAISFGSASDVWSIGASNTLTIGTAGIANTITGAGTFSGTTTSNLTLQGTGSVGTVSFTAGSQNLGRLTINRTSGAIACTLGSALTVNTAANGLTLTAGIVDVGNNVLTVAAASDISGASSVNYVVADRSNGTTAALRKGFSTAPGTVTPYLFPVGDNTLGLDYSPLSVYGSGGTYGGSSYISVAVNDIKHPNMDASTQYLTRYWDISTSGITGSPTLKAFGMYTNTDVNAPTESNYQANIWNGTAWTNAGSPVDATNNFTQPNTYATMIPVVNGTTNHLTAALRDQDINAYQGTNVSNNSGWTYDFGSVPVGNTNPVTFTIQNIGQQALSLSAASPAPAAPYIYTAYTAGSVSSGSTRTFVVTFTPTAGGTFTGSITIPSNDPDEPAYVINFTGIGVVPSPEIDVRGNSIVIPPGNTPSGLDFTLWAGQTIGTTSAAKTYAIHNTGTATLTLTGSFVALGGANPGDWSIASMPSTSIAAPGN